MSRNAVPLALPASKKTRALLGYLVAARSAQPRQRLCDLLWDGPDDPRAALRWSLTKLRPLLDEAGAVRLVADRETVEFVAHGARVDLFDASTHLGGNVAAASTDELTRAAEALTGDFLEGLELPDCYRFHEWCTAERERVRAVRLTVLDALVERFADAPEEALKHARERVAVNPLSDVAQVAVVRLLARLGRRAEAHAQVETCRRILDRELDGRRSPALDLARLEIGKSFPASRAAPAPAPAPASAGPPTTTALVGRVRERDALTALARDAAEGGAHDVVLLSGEPGIGKSRLLDEFASRVRALGGVLLRARAFEAESVRPYGIWVDLLRTVPAADVPHDVRANLALLLPELGEPGNDLETKARLFDGVARLLRELSARGVVAIVVDDLHWLDEASSGLLHYVARVSIGTRVAIACAARDGELTDNAGALRFVRALRREGRLLTLPITPLDEAETAELVAGGVDGADASRIFRESGGNPLFAIEIARSSIEGRSGPRAFEALLEERLERLDGRARDLVVWAAALGRQFDPELLVRVSGDSLSHTVAAIGELEQRGLLTGVGSNAYSFTHELVRRAAYRRLSGPRLRLIHSAIARVLAAAADPGPTWGDVVHHATLADDAELTARACAAAAQRCLRLHARSQARDFASRGLASVARLDADAGLTLRLELLLVVAYSPGADRAKNAAFEENARDAVRIARELGRAADEASGLMALSFFRHTSDDYEGARANTLGSAEALRASDPVASVATIAHSAFCLVLIERDLPKARALIEEAAEIARTHRLTVTDVELGSGALFHFEGDVPLARAALERAVMLARANGNSWRISVALARLAMLALDYGNWDEARARARELRDVATKFGDGAEEATAEALDALAAHGRGEADGVARIASAAKALADLDSKCPLAFLLTLGAEIELRNGAVGRAREWALRGLAAAEPLGRPSAILLARVVLAGADRADGAADAEAVQLRAAEALVSDPYAVSKRAREALRVFTAAASASSNAGTNAAPPGAKLRRQRR